MKKQKSIEIIAFDLRAIAKSHPEHSTLIKSMTQGSNPRYIWGIMSTAAILHHREDDEISGLWDFEGETAEQRDSRIIADMKEELIEHASFFPGGCSDELVRLFFALKPAYYYDYMKEGKAAKKVIKHHKAVYQSAAVALDFDQLLQARNKLEKLLLDSYGEAAFFTPLKSEPPKPRFAVFAQERGLTVKVLLSDQESRTANQELNGVPFAEWSARVPGTFETFIVKTNYWSLDQSLCDPV